jgi:hypothetical protein
MKKHIHADLIHAWADGAEIEWLSILTGHWEGVDMNGKNWHEHYKYRIKPEPKPDVVKYLIRGLVSNSSWLEFDNQTGHEDDGCIKITFDGETGKLKSAEVL